LEDNKTYSSSRVSRGIEKGEELVFDDMKGVDF